MISENIHDMDLLLSSHKGLLNSKEENEYIDLLHLFLDNPEIEDETSLIRLVKLNKILKLLIYDASDKINCFSIGNKTTWLTPDERTNYLLTINSAKEIGMDSVPFNGINLPINMAISALKAINLYAMQCTIVTNMHRSIINDLDNIDEIESYDFTIGYPGKLEF